MPVELEEATLFPNSGAESFAAEASRGKARINGRKGRYDVITDGTGSPGSRTPENKTSGCSVDFADWDPLDSNPLLALCHCIEEYHSTSIHHSSQLSYDFPVASSTTSASTPSIVFIAEKQKTAARYLSLPTALLALYARRRRDREENDYAALGHPIRVYQRVPLHQRDERIHGLRRADATRALVRLRVLSPLLLLLPLSAPLGEAITLPSEEDPQAGRALRLARIGVPVTTPPPRHHPIRTLTPSTTSSSRTLPPPTRTHLPDTREFHTPTGNTHLTRPAMGRALPACALRRVPREAKDADRVVSLRAGSLSFGDTGDTHMHYL
ncbi:hypothetical protein C8R43DRAFT_965805 [Mycena crocata]|nr:hypothetical protein C8R43DRAFT_965805 [Mycena crocata]